MKEKIIIPEYIMDNLDYICLGCLYVDQPEKERCKVAIENETCWRSRDRYWKKI